MSFHDAYQPTQLRSFNSKKFFIRIFHTSCYTAPFVIVINKTNTYYEYVLRKYSAYKITELVTSFYVYRAPATSTQSRGIMYQQSLWLAGTARNWAAGDGGLQS